MSKSLELFRANDQKRQEITNNVAKVVDGLVDESRTLNDVSGTISHELVQQQEVIHQMAEHIQASSKKIKKMDVISQAALESARQANTENDKANEHALISRKAINTSAQKIEGTHDDILRLEKGSNDIGEVIQVITTIAE